MKTRPGYRSDGLREFGCKWGRNGVRDDVGYRGVSSFLNWTPHIFHVYSNIKTLSTDYFFVSSFKYGQSSMYNNMLGKPWWPTACTCFHKTPLCAIWTSKQGIRQNTKGLTCMCTNCNPIEKLCAEKKKCQHVSSGQLVNTDWCDKNFSTQSPRHTTTSQPVL